MLKDPDFIAFLSRLVCVPKCAGCGKRLPPFSKKDNLSYKRVCLCDSCMQSWQIAKREMCHICSMPAGECTCTNFNRKIKQPFIPSIIFYHSDRSKIQNKVLFCAKRKSDPELFEFMAKELAPSVKRLLKESGTDESHCVMTWIPRKTDAVKKYGHDQAKLLCLALAQELDCHLALPLLERRGGKEQKKLDARSRDKNIGESVFLRKRLTRKDRKKLKQVLPNADSITPRDVVEGRTVIVIDDIITTGASMRRAILLLEPQKPKSVLAACVARSEIKSKSQMPKKDKNNE
ncbi:MAG: ComF family protein [Ruminococcaceae bacterium]|nr:ComF family protein [Oscillospiraceae bacterium]